jgi:signal peptidase I
MITCPQCGFYNMDDRTRCLKCNADLTFAPEEKAPRARGLPSLRVTAMLMRGVRGLKPFFFPRPENLDIPFRNPALAAMLSLIPGGGQLYNRQKTLAVIHYFVFAGLIAAGIAIILHPASNAFFLAALLWMVYSVNQALNAAQTINGATIMGLTAWRGFFLLSFLVSVALSSLQWLAMIWILMGLLVFLTSTALAVNEGPDHDKASALQRLMPAIALVIITLAMMVYLPGFYFRSFVSLRSIGQYAYAPLVRHSDRVLFESMGFGLKGPQLGDIVLYDPPRFKMEQGRDLFPVNMTLNMERIVGLEGDVVERRAGVWYRNDEPAPPWEQPLVQDELWDDLRLEVPAGHYAVLISYGPVEWMVLGTAKAPALKHAIVHGWHEASVVTAREMYGRAVCVYSPARNRKWLTLSKMREQHESYSQNIFE